MMNQSERRAPARTDLTHNNNKCSQIMRRRTIIKVIIFINSFIYAIPRLLLMATAKTWTTTRNEDEAIKPGEGQPAAAQCEILPPFNEKCILSLMPPVCRRIILYYPWRPAKQGPFPLSIAVCEQSIARALQCGKIKTAQPERQSLSDNAAYNLLQDNNEPRRRRERHGIEDVENHGYYHVTQANAVHADSG